MTTAIEIARRPSRTCRTSRTFVTAGMTLVSAVVLVGALIPVAPADAHARPLQPSTHTVWLCRPGAATDPCAADRTATSVGAHLNKAAFSIPVTARAKNFDCFFVYPTVSAEPSFNSDLAIQREEIDIANGQASQFSSVCNVWAPRFRQATKAALDDGEAFTPQVIATAYQSLLTAWKHYLAHDNHGHAVVVIGHSQGAAMLIRLLRSQVDPSAGMRKKLVSAILLGGNVQVARGHDADGSFRHIPTCASTSSTGCVIAYSTFASELGRNAVVGRPGQGVSIQSGQATRRGQQVACVYPATFSSKAGDVVPMYPTVVHPTAGVITPGLRSPRCTPPSECSKAVPAGCRYTGSFRPRKMSGRP